MPALVGLRYPLNTALTVPTSLAQIGEFSFILAGLGLSPGLLPAEGMSLVRSLEQRDHPYAELPVSTEHKCLKGQVVLVGSGRVGRRIAAALDARGIPCGVAEQKREPGEDLRKQGKAAVLGNAADPAVLIQAHIAHAAMLVVSTPDALNIRQMADTARTLNPGIEIVLLRHGEDESQLLRQEDIGTVFYGEEELAKSMTGHVLGRFDPQLAAAASGQAGLALHSKGAWPTADPDPHDTSVRFKKVKK